MSAPREDYADAIKNFEDGAASRDAEVAELRATNLRLIRGDFNQICSHCAWEAATPATWEQLQAHIQECPSHPIATLKREIEELQTKLTESNAKLLNVLQGHNISGIAGQVIIDLQAKLTELREQNRALLANANHKLRDKLTAAEEKLAKIYATEPVAWRSESYCSINMALSPPFGQVAVLLIPKPQEPT